MILPFRYPTHKLDHPIHKPDRLTRRKDLLTNSHGLNPHYAGNRTDKSGHSTQRLILRSTHGRTPTMVVGWVTAGAVDRGWTSSMLCQLGTSVEGALTKSTLLFVGPGFSLSFAVLLLRVNVCDTHAFPPFCISSALAVFFTLELHGWM